MARLMLLATTLRFCRQFATDRRGVTALEYGLIAALIAAAVITGATTLGTNLSSTFNSIGGKL